MNKKIILIIIGYVLVAAIAAGITFAIVSRDECDCKCDTKETTKKKGRIVDANVVLATACSQVDVDGNYTDDKVSCSDFVCTYNADGTSYTKYCAED